MAESRTRWTRKRVIALCTAVGSTALTLGWIVLKAVYTGSTQLDSLQWAVLLTSVVLWCNYLAATVTAEISTELTTKLAAVIRTEVAKLLKPIDSKIEEIDADVHEYGDRREAEGAALALKIVGQRSNTGGRHLTPVE
jgi:hypothetical protein